MSDPQTRRVILEQIESERDSRAILYVTGSRQGLETQIGQDVIDLFVDHLDAMGPVQKISLILETNGGQTSAAWNLINLIRMFCEELELIVPADCRSAGTLIALGANQIVMTKQATLGPIDPSIAHALGPQIPGGAQDARVPVSVEAVTGYLQHLNATNAGGDAIVEAVQHLAQYVHPLVLGEILRSRQQIRDLAGRLLEQHPLDQLQINRIVDFLCSASGSHDYTLNRREALRLRLPVEQCPWELYSHLRELRRSYGDQMQLREPFDPSTLAIESDVPTQYSLVRALIESTVYGAYHFVTEGTALRTTVSVQDPTVPFPVPVEQLQNTQIFEGWRIAS